MALENEQNPVKKVAGSQPPAVAVEEEPSLAVPEDQQEEELLEMCSYYCPNCKKLHSYAEAFKKQKIEHDVSGGSSSSKAFRFLLCHVCGKDFASMGSTVIENRERWRKAPLRQSVSSSSSESDPELNDEQQGPIVSIYNVVDHPNDPLYHRCELDNPDIINNHPVDKFNNSKEDH